MRYYTLVVINKQGASEQTWHRTKTAIRSAIREKWSDPENLKARVFDEGGNLLYHGSALGFGNRKRNPREKP